MTVKAILSGKGNAVITIEPTVPLGDAVKILEEHGIGAAVITDTDQHVLGILSERDIVRTLARNVRAGGACRLCDESVGQVMTRRYAILVLGILALGSLMYSLKVASPQTMPEFLLASE